MEEEHLDIIKHNTELIAPCITSILVFEKEESSAKNWLTGGTGFFVEMNEVKFMITALHIYEKIEELREEKEISILISADNKEPLDISAWKVISSNKEADIIVLALPVSFDLSILGKECFKINKSNALRVKEKESVFLLGFPAEHRIGSTKKIACFMTPIMDDVTGVSEITFTIADESDERTVSIFNNIHHTIESFGGMSGSPVFAVRNGIFDLVGIFIQGGGFVSGVHAPLIATHFDLVGLDGKIDELKIPPRV